MVRVIKLTEDLHFRETIEGPLLNDELDGSSKQRYHPNHQEAKVRENNSTLSYQKGGKNGKVPA